MDEIISAIVEELTTLLSSEATFSAEVLQVLVENAVREVKAARRYPSWYEDSDIAYDIEQYYSNIRDLALYDYNQRGAEFETEHNENGVNRTYLRRSALKDIVPFAKF